MASLGRRRGSSAMVDSPRNTASVFSACSSLDLLPPAGDADPWLHRDYLSPRPHRSVLTGSLETEPKVPVWLARHGCFRISGVRPHPTSSLVYLRYKSLASAAGTGCWQQIRKCRERLPPRPRGKGFTRQMIELEEPSARQLEFRTDEVHKNYSCIQVGI